MIYIILSIAFFLTGLVVGYKIRDKNYSRMKRPVLIKNVKYKI